MTSALRLCFSKSVFATCPWLSVALGCLLVMGTAPSPLHSQTYTDLYNFGPCETEGCNPYYAGILAQGRDGNLYGTLSVDGLLGGGTVFKITPAGAITTLYSFSGTGGGSLPDSGLTLGTDGNFYGADLNGGFSYGTIFKITPTGVLTTLHSFNSFDGGKPYAPPVEGSDGNYYGVTDYSTAYSVTSSGTFKLLNPLIPGRSVAPLFLAPDGYFYGTTLDGGTFNDGTVFRMSAAGKVKIVFSFDGIHGAQPYGPVVQGSDGFLYGTTSGGGSVANPGGVVFKLSKAGAITVLHEFDSTSTTDGYQPYAGLVAATDGVEGEKRVK